METTLIEHCERALKDDPTGQRKKFLLIELEASKNAYVKAADMIEGQVRALTARAREIDVFLKALEERKFEK